MAVADVVCLYHQRMRHTLCLTLGFVIDARERYPVSSAKHYVKS